MSITYNKKQCERQSKKEGESGFCRETEKQKDKYITRKNYKIDKV